MEKIFKAKRIDNGEWVEFNLFDGVSAITWEIYDKNTVCQYTGIKDSEGQRIFEGDEMDFIDDKFYVVYSNARYVLKKKDSDSHWAMDGYGTLTGHNIHDKD